MDKGVLAVRKPVLKPTTELILVLIRCLPGKPGMSNSAGKILSTYYQAEGQTLCVSLVLEAHFSYPFRDVIMDIRY